MVILRYDSGTHWQVPLIVAVLAAFTFGVATGVAASLAMIVLRPRRELASVQRPADASQVPAQLTDAL